VQSGAAAGWCRTLALSGKTTVGVNGVACAKKSKKDGKEIQKKIQKGPEDVRFNHSRPFVFLLHLTARDPSPEAITG
jgi:hypothetical protein